MRARTLMTTGLVGLLLATGHLAAAAVLVNGAGATFPYPLYSKWFDEFHRANPEVQINYQSIGSGGGIRQVLEGTIDFGATDSPMSDEQLASASKRILHLPTALGAIVPTYNLKGVDGLRLTAKAIAGIFLGQITRWNDPAIASANPGVALPDMGIVVIHRSDGSGTTYVFTDYLAKVSDVWRGKVGRGTSVNWPTGLGGKGNEGVAGLLRQTPSSIGYVELIYAIQTKLPYANVQNRAGRFVRPSVETVTAAAGAAAATMPADFRVSITDAAGEEAYPIASFTWLLVPTRIDDARKGTALKEFLAWMLGDGQRFAAPLHYAPLPPEVVALEQAVLDQIQVGAH